MHKQNGRYYVKLGWEAFCWDLFSGLSDGKRTRVLNRSFVPYIVELGEIPTMLMAGAMCDAAHAELTKNQSLVVSSQDQFGGFTVELR